MTESGRSRTLGSKTSLSVKSGDRLRIETPGGGGYGRPKKVKR